MISNEVFMIKSRSETLFYTSRRELSKSILKGFAGKTNYQKDAPIVIRYERGPTHQQNDDIAPALRNFLQELPDFIMSNAHERAELTDAMESKVNEVLR